MTLGITNDLLLNRLASIEKQLKDVSLHPGDNYKLVIDNCGTSYSHIFFEDTTNGSLCGLFLSEQAMNRDELYHYQQGLFDMLRVIKQKCIVPTITGGFKSKRDNEKDNNNNDN